MDWTHVVISCEHSNGTSGYKMLGATVCSSNRTVLHGIICLLRRKLVSLVKRHAIAPRVCKLGVR
jgi:hypothetical protein